MTQTVYVDTDEVKKTLSVVGSDFLDDELENAALAISAGIDLAMGRSFGKDSDDVERVYTAWDPYLISINDLAELTSLKTDEDRDGVFEREWDTTDYVLGPLNADADSKPWTRIDYRVGGRYRFPLVQAAVQVTGKWGWPNVPPQIPEACWILVEQLNIRKRKMPMGFQITSESVAYIARHDPQLAFLFNGLSRPRLAT